MMQKQKIPAAPIHFNTKQANGKEKENSNCFCLNEFPQFYGSMQYLNSLKFVCLLKPQSSIGHLSGLVLIRFDP